MFARTSRWGALALLLTGLVVAPSPATTLGVTFTSSPFVFTSALTLTRGWEFDVLAPIQVTSLGFWDEGGLGLAGAHDVGLWNASSTLLASTTVPAGVAAPLVGPDGFRFVDLGTAVSLTPGTYRIGATFTAGDGDQIAKEAGPLGAPGFVSYVGPRNSPGAAFGDPTNASSNTEGQFGPNFLFAAAVPEPSTLLFLGAGLVGLLRRRS